jgi:dGTPase
MERLLAPLGESHGAGLNKRLSEPDREGDAQQQTYRTKAQRDRDRVLYCSAFQRLAGVTQVTAAESGYRFHNRLGHSLKVAQVGRRNAERLQLLAKQSSLTGAAARIVRALDPDAVEASCLAHDLGHPPFGHIAEEVLNRRATDHTTDGFEGNAQSFRIATRLAIRTESPGLDLTRRTLDGLLKYPWRRWTDGSDRSPGGKRERKWGYYQEDVEAFRFARAGWPPETPEMLPEVSLAAEIMNWADDLTYAVHDVDDFFRAGLVPLDRLGEPDGNEQRHLERLMREVQEDHPAGFPPESVEALAEAVVRIIGLHGPDAPYEHTLSARARMRSFGTKLITKYLEAFTVTVDGATNRAKLVVDAESELEVAGLKMLVNVYVIHRPGLAAVQHGQRRVIADLFDYYFKASAPPGEPGSDRRLFPPGARERLIQTDGTAAARARVVVDLIAGLTEEAAIQLHHRLSGGWTASALDATATVG